MLLLAGPARSADDELSEFIRSVSQAPATQQALWLNAEHKQQINDQFDYQLNRLRLRYWTASETSVWVLDEVGKEQPITMAVAVTDQKIRAIEVLSYRESRGGEIRYPFFRDQFKGAELTTSAKLSQRIDGITGATLSVRAMEKVAKVALFLDQLASSSKQ